MEREIAVLTQVILVDILINFWLGLDLIFCSIWFVC